MPNATLYLGLIRRKLISVHHRHDTLKDMAGAWSLYTKGKLPF